MIFRILKATEENPIKCDFVSTCKKYFETLKLKQAKAEFMPSSSLVEIEVEVGVGVGVEVNK